MSDRHGLLGRVLFPRTRHQILIFHRVLSGPDEMLPGEVTADWFEGLLTELRSIFDVIPLVDAVGKGINRRGKRPTLSITFDDGYADNFSVALPILEQLELPATFFVASGFIDGGRMWNDSIIETFRRLEKGSHAIDLPTPTTFRIDGADSRRRAMEATIKALKHLHPAERQGRVDDLAARVSGLPDDLMMTSDQLAKMAASPFATIGGHTRNHPILASISLDEARAEIEQGKRDLEQVIDDELVLFAYPNGKLGRDYRSEHAKLVREAGFKAAVATDWGAMSATDDRFHIPRFTPWHRNYRRFVFDLARCHYGLLS